jgi:hypothetical protein
MPSIKQIQQRLLTKKNSLNDINSSIDRASSNTNKIILRRLYQEKGSLGRDVRNLERQLSTMKDASLKLKISTDEIEGY